MTGIMHTPSDKTEQIKVQIDGNLLRLVRNVSEPHSEKDLFQDLKSLESDPNVDERIRSLATIVLSLCSSS